MHYKTVRTKSLPLKIKYSIITILPLIISLTLFSCSKSDDGGSEVSDDTWYVMESIVGDCSGEEYPQIETETAAVSRTGNIITIALSSGSFTGTVSDNTFTWQGDMPEGSGTNSISMNCTISNDGYKIMGAGTWTWTDGDDACSGTVDMIIVKAAQSQVNISGRWGGTYIIAGYGSEKGRFVVDLVQSGNTLSGKFDASDLGIYDADLQGTISGGSITFGDIDNTISFEGKIGQGSWLAGTFTYDAYVAGIWEAGARETGTLTVVKSLDIPIDVYPEGLAFDGTSLWLSDSYGYKIYNIDISTGNTLKTLDSPDDGGSTVRWPTGITFDGTYLWVADENLAGIYQISTDGTVNLSFDSPGEAPEALAYDGEFLWNVDMFDRVIYKMDTAGNVKGSIDSPCTDAAGMTWDGTNFWIVDEAFTGKNRIYKIDSAGDIITEYTAPSEFTSGIAHDGTYLWSADWLESKIYQLRIE